MKNALLLYIIITIFLTSCAKEPTCKDFKTGTFVYASKTPYTIYRNDTLQIEKHNSAE